jgi:hypothetical protein
VKLLADPTMQLFLPRWSPSGGSIVAMRSETAGVESVWILDPTGARAPRRVKGPPFRRGDGDTAIDWTSDGGALLTTARGDVPDDSGRVATIDPGTGAVAPLPGLPRARMATPCGPGQVLFRASGPFGPAAAGDLVLVGVDGTNPTVLLPKARAAHLFVGGCARR